MVILKLYICKTIWMIWFGIFVVVIIGRLLSEHSHVCVILPSLLACPSPVSSFSHGSILFFRFLFSAFRCFLISAFRCFLFYWFCFLLSLVFCFQISFFRCLMVLLCFFLRRSIFFLLMCSVFGLVLSFCFFLYYYSVFFTVALYHFVNVFCFHSFFFCIEPVLFLQLLVDNGKMLVKISTTLSPSSSSCIRRKT
ncbi:hypothetical protein Droror1_Dr00012597 [Drosera rotundifolia]